MNDLTNILVFGGVVLARFLVPLFIPRYPLPAIITALILDAADQTIFQQYTTLSLGQPTSAYQAYDKALDIYYLTIAYISTLYNWTNRSALIFSRLLFYYRMIGVVLFELSKERFLLLIFPNTVEYFFIVYEAVRLWRNPRRFSTRQVMGAIAAIWIGIKLPQEYIVHIAQIDTSDWMRTTVYHVPVNTSFIDMLRAQPQITQALLIVLVVLPGVGIWLFRKLPPPDHRFTFASPPYAAPEQQPKTPHTDRTLTLLEKLFLLSSVTIIFAQLLPNVEASLWQLSVGAAVFIVVNKVSSSWLTRRRGGPVTTVRDFFVLAVVNFGLLQVISILFPNQLGSLSIVDSFSFTLLLTLLTTLFDRYHSVYRWRFSPDTFVVSSYVEK